MRLQRRRRRRTASLGRVQGVVVAVAAVVAVAVLNRRMRMTTVVHHQVMVMKSLMQRHSMSRSKGLQQLAGVHALVMLSRSQTTGSVLT